MDKTDIGTIGEAAYASMIDIIKTRRRDNSVVVGFDTEYTSKGHELLCAQFASATGEILVETDTLTPHIMARELRKIIPAETKHVTLVAFFAIAELQHIDIYKYAIDVHHYGASTDFVFYSRRYDLLMRTWDLARFFPGQGLWKVAESFGMEKYEYDTETVTRRSIRSARFREYAIHDARLCRDILGELRRGFSAWNVDPLFEATPASSAASAFRRTLDSPIHPPASRHRFVGMLACWGGRAEAFARGSLGEMHEHDLVSAYPTAAASFGQLPIRGSWKAFSRMSETRRFIGGVARVRFRFPADELYPCIPVSTKHALLYPSAGEAACTLDELRLAQELGAVIHIVEGYGYTKGSSLFCGYMEQLLHDREHETDPIKRIALKLLANSCIGKLAQRVADPDPYDVLKLARRLGIDPMGRLTRAEYEALGIGVRIRVGALWFPEWNALITGRVRAIIGRAVRNTNAVYAATDAVWTKQKHPPASELGCHWEHKRSGKCVVARTRLARMGTHIAHHSIWKRSVGHDILDLVEAGRYETPLVYDIEKPRKFKEAIATRERYGEWRWLERRASGTWDEKRKLSPSGKRSFPWPSETAYTEARQRNLRTGGPR